MEFRIADTFTDSLARLSGEEQKAVKMAAFDLQLNPSHPSMCIHKLDHAKDKNFWSVRVSRDERGGVGYPAPRHLAAVREATVGAHRGQGDQPPGRRDDEGVPGVS